MNEADWKRLLRQIRQGYVVPVVGSQFLAGADSFQHAVAAELLRAYDLPAEAAPLPAFLPVSQVVARLRREAGATLQDLYTDVHDAIETVTARVEAAMPAPLAQLAAISDFRLFVTTTPDDLLARCLRRRIGVDEIIHAPKLPTSEWHDLTPGWSTRGGQVPLLYLFGKSRAAPVYAIHEEDILEYAHNVISRGSQVPVNFLGALQERSLLLLGCGFPDWLGRFFLRATNTSRLAEKSKREWMVEPRDGNEGLVAFLRSYSAETEMLVEASPAAFVAELHQRWLAERPPPGAPGPAVPPAEEPRGRAIFFISYSRGADLAAADALRASLLALGVAEHEVWLDRENIDAGKNFRHEILDGIQGCRYFLPLLSQATDAREQGFVFREWRAANDRALDMNRDFIVPLVVDADFQPGRYDAEPVRAWAQLDYGHAPGGVPDEGTRRRLVALLREARRAEPVLA